MGIDPSIKKGHAFSIWHEKELISWATFHIMDELSDILFIEWVEEVYIEDQYLNQNYKTAKELTLEVGKIAGICDLRGRKYHLVNPATWQSKVNLYSIKELKGLSYYKKKKRKEKMLIEKANSCIGDCHSSKISIDDPDLASSILIPYAMEIIGT